MEGDMSSVSFIKILADLTFASHQHKMPPADSWKSPQGDEAQEHYQKGVVKDNWGQGFPAADGFVSYFATQDMHKYHFDAAKTNTSNYKKFIGTMLDGIQYAFNLWRPTLYFKDIKVNGPCAIGSKGCLTTTAKFEDIFKSFPGHLQLAQGSFFNDWRDAVGTGVGKCLKNYIDSVMITGFPWYPAFAAFPGPVAPPMPNIAWPLIACPAPKLTDITVPDNLKKAMNDAFSSSLKDKINDKIHETVFEAIATAAATGFLIWVSTQMINLVMSTGNIPTFAPPWVPVGPVVNGQNIPSGGGNLL